jgi:hypothetical protein
LPGIAGPALPIFQRPEINRLWTVHSLCQTIQRWEYPAGKKYFRPPLIGAAPVKAIFYNAVLHIAV